MNRSIVVLLLTICTVFISTGQSICSSLSDVKNGDIEVLFPNISGITRELYPTIIECVTRNDTSHPVFHGCIDWHSAVHGHWALLRSFRVVKEKDVLQTVTNSMQPNGMRKEYEYLKSHPSFEMPYGRSWFLKLIIEYETVTGDEQFRYISEFVAKSIMSYINSMDFNDNIYEYSNLSWAYRNLLEYYCHVNDSEGVSCLRGKLENIKKADATLESDYRTSLFFSNWGNLNHLLVLAWDKKRFNVWITHNIQKYRDLRPIRNFKGEHHLGINYARAWSFWSIYLKTKDLVYLQAYQEHVKDNFSLNSRYKKDYFSYGHWVPQFGIYAVTAPLFENGLCD